MKDDRGSVAEHAEKLGLFAEIDACIALHRELHHQLESMWGSGISNVKAFELLHELTHPWFFADAHSPTCAETYRRASAYLNSLPENSFYLRASDLFHETAETLDKLAEKAA